MLHIHVRVGIGALATSAVVVGWQLVPFHWLHSTGYIPLGTYTFDTGVSDDCRCSVGSAGQWRELVL